MSLSIAHLGPPGTYAEQATVLYVNWLTQTTGIEAILCPYPSIAQSLQAVAAGKTKLAVVPVENSIEGSVTMTMDALWQLDSLRIRMALVMPIAHMLISCTNSLNTIKTVYSHPQALAQCQGWLGQFLPTVQLIPSNSTTEALQIVKQDLTVAAIASSRAAELYNLPILAKTINDYPENCTRFLVVSQDNLAFEYQIASANATHTSIAFSVPANIPGALLKPLQVFAELGINLSRIESRPTKRSLGEYLFFMDLEIDGNAPKMQSALSQLTNYIEILKIFGSYSVLPISTID
ncbi:prephenate dehydratase [Nostoc sp. FACHB-152]|uniref:prephenate dehydratase n=1 Tax=unclassified Nostoc TaxID=2593658 RepID=UPI0016850C03|nr:MULTISPECIES: prephenate dehydratase [unclassified Nostoc]MBD2447940.1 prephenate dehydratase [Nostoc sp. FACHB-152]MBD2468486.1 prephenate dehydratase [Nostoc sp. FACHB-145]